MGDGSGEDDQWAFSMMHLGFTCLGKQWLQQLRRGCGGQLSSLCLASLSINRDVQRESRPLNSTFHIHIDDSPCLGTVRSAAWEKDRDLPLRLQIPMTGLPGDVKLKGLSRSIVFKFGAFTYLNGGTWCPR